MEHKKRSFFERLTGNVGHDEEEIEERRDVKKISVNSDRLERGSTKKENPNWMEEENDEAELTVDVFQTQTEIIIQTMVAGVKPEDLELTLARDMITVRGKREETRNVDEEDYFTKELYWGRFSRTIMLPQEVEPEDAEAIEKHGLLTIKLQKVDREKRNNVKVKSI